MSAHVSAKLAAPTTDDIVRRARVTEAIDRALRDGACWIAAPAGYGKTTAMIDYLASVRAPHVWFRADQGDRDLARFFSYLAQSLPTPAASLAMPIFGVEYAEHPRDFARVFFRQYFARLRPGTLLVFDDLHTVETPEFGDIIGTMIGTLPRSLRCVCLSRMLPNEGLSELSHSRALTVVDQSVLEFSDPEARSLVQLRLKQRAAQIDIGSARGWAVGLVLLADRGGAAGHGSAATQAGPSHFAALGGHFFDALPVSDQDNLLTLNLLPEITVGLANAVTGSAEAGQLLDRLYARQFLVTRAEGQGETFHLHDLLRDFLHRRFEQRLSEPERRMLRTRAARLLSDAERPDEAITLALDARSWLLARDLLLRHAEGLIATGRRATIIAWLQRLPPAELTGWLFYWAGVAHLADDAVAERWLELAWQAFGEDHDERGLCLTVARAVLVKTDSWRTHHGLAVWTSRAVAIAARDLPALPPEEDLLALIGLLRAHDFADGHDNDAGQRLAEVLLDRLGDPGRRFPSGLRLQASEALIEHAVGRGRADIFERAVDHVVDDIAKPDVLGWHLGLWLVAFGAASGRYYRYSRRGFPYATAEDALRAAIAIGEGEALKGVEFGALYHLQLQMKLRNDFSEFRSLVTRLAEIADSRYTTQVAVVADCRAALHTLQGNFAEAYRDCDRFMEAIEAGDEPLIERLPHYITKFQVLLADRRCRDAIGLLADLAPRLQGGSQLRTRLCMMAAEALGAKWQGDPAYEGHLRALFAELRTADWRAILLNLPDLLSDLLADAIETGIEIAFCRSLVAERRLTPPAHRPAGWPWPLRVRILGGFRIERDGAELDLGPKPPTRALDILRVLALSRGHVCAIGTLQDRLWPDLDGGQANAAFEQALHRLRKLLGRADLVTLREGRLRLVPDMVWVDLADWEKQVRDVHAAGGSVSERTLEQLLASFPGPLFFGHDEPIWAIAAADRVRDDFVDLAIRLGKLREGEGTVVEARAVCLRALQHYPDSDRLHGALIELRLMQGDLAGAVEDYRRYLRVLKTAGDLEPSPIVEAIARKFGSAPGAR
ncbi:BTAD domain-containing putative transcriptional regulator [Phreatobacter stygius]|uniref:Bacterial transcriptional activator domain-containing protein n=1 Tax=Phreatobacter stygius TaxID=1940610 RepID=A0A4D7BJR2_9HYPH|nr:BTAD domain-containing putative transcriptional regulator [Phreatobacter stygius]QCI67957.1 hypothetical protein E8M01_29255 [Phreatobacter stygius]